MRRESEQYTIYSSNNNNNQTNINLNINSSEISENNNNNTSTNTNNNSISGNVNGVNGSSSTAASIVTSGLHQNQFYSSPFNFNGYGGAAYPALGAFAGKVSLYENFHK